MPEHDPLEADMLRGAVAALRKRAQRQAQPAAAGTTRGDRGVSVRTGEAAIADWPHFLVVVDGRAPEGNGDKGTPRYLFEVRAGIEVSALTPRSAERRSQRA
jgi:hypothetical protein